MSTSSSVIGGRGGGPGAAVTGLALALAVLASACTDLAGAAATAAAAAATATGHAVTNDDTGNQNNSVYYNVVDVLNGIDGIGKAEYVIRDNSTNDGAIGPGWPSVARTADGTSASSGRGTSGSLIERFPWAASYGNVCGATILSATWLLTAAHCTLSTHGLNAVTVGTGEPGAASPPAQRVPVKRAIVHPRFTVGPYWLNTFAYNISQVGARYDYMLLELERPLVLDGVRTRAANLLPVAARPPTAAPAPLFAEFLGLGSEVHGGYTRQDFQLKRFEVVPLAQCAAMPEFVADEMMCLRGGVPPHNSYACNGDSGSGATVGGRLAGVVSWVERDAHECDPRWKLVLMRLDPARLWIRQHTGL